MLPAAAAASSLSRRLPRLSSSASARQQQPRRRALFSSSSSAASFDCDVLVCGAGVVGLAVARAFARAGREVLIVEAEGSFGTKTSSRNSEVIHAGIYYPPGSLKARLCIQGRKLLYALCEAHGVPYRRCGKLIVATSDTEDEFQRLEAIRFRAHQSGVPDVRYLSQEGARALEPNVQCTKALFSPSTGIIDSHQLMLALLGEAEAHGASVAYHSRLHIQSITHTDGAAHVSIHQQQQHDEGEDGGGSSEISIEEKNNGGSSSSGTTLRPRLLVNAAGLGALGLARETAARMPASSPFSISNYPPPRFCKGNYFRLAYGPSPFARLVYPLPEAAGLGVHATVDLGGQTRFGPDVEWVEDAEDLAVNPRRADAFYAAIRRYWPALEDGQLAPDYAGIRPKLQAPTDPTGKDFWIDRPTPHVIHLLGIESPGLTASLALADYVVTLSGEMK